MTDTTTPTTTDRSAVVEAYFTCWNTPDPQARAAAIATTWTEGSRYVDPLADATGHEQIAAMMGAVADAYPGHTFRLAGPIDAHHDVARFAWEMVDGAGGVVIGGLDAALFDDAGRIAYVVGFLDPQAAT
ncbi:MAG: nuclear transport factor 2 family protein [Actinomycetota bacterium]|nr:nuclear transport factor 2 family protein [Actinomycetota bacterium]